MSEWEMRLATGVPRKDKPRVDTLLTIDRAGPDMGSERLRQGMADAGDDRHCKAWRARSDLDRDLPFAALF
ncbi:MAG: hypothetical protein ACLTSZ_03350 [Lachnospiraceae bacterium]